MSKRKRGGANKPADPSTGVATTVGSRVEQPRASTLGSRAEEPRASTLGSRAEEPRASTARPAGEPEKLPKRAEESRAGQPGASTRKTTAQRGARAEPRAALPTEPPAPQGKPIKISDLRVPPLPQLEAKPAAASKLGSPTPARASKRPSTRPPPPSAEPSKPEPQPPAKVVEPPVVRVEPPAAGPAAAGPALERPPASVLGSRAEPSASTGSTNGTVAPPNKGARLVEQRGAAEQPADADEEPARPRVDLDERSTRPVDERSAALPVDEPTVPRAAGADSAAAKSVGNGQAAAPTLHLVDSAMPVNGAVFDGTGDDDIWTEGIENTASAAAALPDDKAANEQDDAGSHAPAARLARGSGGDRAREAAAFGSSQSLLSTDYYFRQYGAHGLRSMAADVDDFGFDPHVDAKVRPLLETMCKRYFRVELQGAERVPEQGRALLVANRSGALPWDGLVLRTALRSARPGLSPLRWLAEDSVIHYPFMGVFMNRLGAVRACPENAERLLTQDRLVAVFPEGAQGSRKLFRDRYRLQRFGRGGYVKLALKLGVPILPTAIIGAEETNPVLGRSRLLGRFVGSDSVPITPTFPWLGLAGLLPAPVRWRIVVGAPIDLSSYGPDSADDALVVHRLNEQIRSSLQTLVDQGKQQRGSALFG